MWTLRDSDGLEERDALMCQATCLLIQRDLSMSLRSPAHAYNHRKCMVSVPAVCILQILQNSMKSIDKNINHLTLLCAHLLWIIFNEE